MIEIIADTSFDEYKGFYAQLEGRAEKSMDALAASYGGGHVKIERQILYGNRVREILKFAAEHQIDLIIMNSHRVDLEDPVQGWGTISYKIGVLAQCPVMLVK